MTGFLDWLASAGASVNLQFRMETLFAGVGIILLIALPLIGVILFDRYSAKRVLDRLDEARKINEAETRAWLKRPNAFAGYAGLSESNGANERSVPNAGARRG